MHVEFVRKERIKMKKAYKGQLGHEQVFNIIAKIIIPLLIVLGGIFSLIWLARSGLEEVKKKAMQERVTKELEELKNELSTRCKEESNYWVCDTYQTSYLIGKIIANIWKECLACGCCDKGLPAEAQPLSRFLYNHPIKVSFSSCSDYGLNDIYSCPHEGIVSEWTVTAWGLRKELGFCGEKGFGNSDCGYACFGKDFGSQELEHSCEDVPGNSCESFCSGEDRVDWKAGIITAGEIIKDLQIEFSDKKIIIKRELWSSTSVCDYLEIGKCKVEICPLAWDKSDNSEVRYGFYEVTRDSRSTWICDNPNKCEKNFKFSYSLYTPKEFFSLKENELEIMLSPIQKNAKNKINIGFKINIISKKECKLYKCEGVMNPDYACILENGTQSLDASCKEKISYMLDPDNLRLNAGGYMKVSYKIIFNYCGDKNCACGENSENCSEDCK